MSFLPRTSPERVRAGGSCYPSSDHEIPLLPVRIASQRIGGYHFGSTLPCYDTMLELRSYPLSLTAKLGRPPLPPVARPMHCTILRIRQPPPTPPRDEQSPFMRMGTPIWTSSPTVPTVGNGRPSPRLGIPPLLVSAVYTRLQQTAACLRPPRSLEQ